MDTFCVFYAEKQKGVPLLHSSYDDWRFVHQCSDSENSVSFLPGDWNYYWYTHKENVGVLNVCRYCGENMMLESGDKLDIRLDPASKSAMESDWVRAAGKQ
ncbi:hypothetical protein LCGC14_0671070 [marine sediment metagenome]|uniref:Uncharacterized protein n=1 Tax=marine sediment metagenome TaxID=412755 RepID=A0A0F9RB47_9ZZZZ